MSKALSILIMSALLLGLAGSAIHAQETETDPLAVVDAVYQAVMDQDLELAGGYLADDAVLVLIPPPPGTDGTFVGRDAILGWYENLIQNNLAIELSNGETAGDRFTVTNLTWVDDLPVAPVEFDGAGIVQNGQVKSMSWVITPASMHEMEMAMTRGANEALGHRYIEEMWNNGNMEAADEMLADDFVDIYPKPGFEPDKAGLMADAAGFHEMGLYDRVDQVIATEDAIAIQVTVFRPTDGGGQEEFAVAFILLDVEDGKITSRRVGFPGW